jgi:hypothetical protein
MRYRRERKTGQIGNTGKLREEGGIIDNRGNRERHNVFVFGFGGLLRRRLIGSQISSPTRCGLRFVWGR